jgi:hypothetical protein
MAGFGLKDTKMDDADRKFELHKLELEHRFQSAKFDREQALEKEKLDREHLFESRKEYARQVLEYALQFDRHLKEYGQLALRSIFLLNGGAVLALLTFIGSSIGKSVGSTSVLPSMFVSAFVLYCAGLVACAISMTFAYLNYMGHHNSRADPGALANNMIAQREKWPGNFSVGNIRLISWSWKLAFLFGLTALVLFAAGCIKVAYVFQALK